MVMELLKTMLNTYLFCYISFTQGWITDFEYIIIDLPHCTERNIKKPPLTLKGIYFRVRIYYFGRT